MSRKTTSKNIALGEKVIAWINKRKKLRQRCTRPFSYCRVEGGGGNWNDDGVRRLIKNRWLNVFWGLITLFSSPFYRCVYTKSSSLPISGIMNVIRVDQHASVIKQGVNCIVFALIWKMHRCIVVSNYITCNRLKVCLEVIGYCNPNDLWWLNGLYWNTKVREQGILLWTHIVCRSIII